MPREKRSALKLTPEIIETISVALRAGNYVEIAARFAGVPRSSLYRWMQKGEDALFKQEQGEQLSGNDAMYLDLFNAVENARAQAIVRNVSLISQAAQGGQWQAAAWWLERTNPKQWGRRVMTEVSGPDNNPVQVNVSVDDLEQLVQTILSADDSS